MAINYLSSINLNKNELQNGVIHVLAANPSNPVAGQIYYNSTDTKLYFYDGTIWVDASGDIKSVVTSTSSQIAITDSTGPNPSLAIVTGAVTNNGTALATGDQIFDYVTTAIGNIAFTIQGTTNEVDVTNGTSMGNGGTATIGLPSDVTVTNNLNVGNNLNVSGSSFLDGFVTIDHNLNVQASGVIQMGGTEVISATRVIRGSSGLFSSDVNVSNNLDVTGNAVIGGNLTVNGTTTTIDTNTVNIGDNIITLNSDETGSPTQDAGIEVERGTGANKSLIWDESASEWTIQQASGTNERIATYADSKEDVILQETGSSGITVTETLSGTDNRIKTYDLAVNLSDLSFKTSIGDGSTLSYAVTHNLGTKDVIVQLYDVSSNDTVYTDVVRNTVNQITVTFTTAPSSNDIRVLVQKL
jgi:hypothetical protein